MVELLVMGQDDQNILNTTYQLNSCKLSSEMSKILMKSLGTRRNINISHDGTSEKLLKSWFKK